jgi:hypothetical protein
MVLVSVVTDNIRVLRLLWSPEYHQDIVSPEKDLAIRVSSFSRHDLGLVIKDLQADMET